MTAVKEIVLENLTVGYRSGKREKVVARNLCTTVKGGLLTCLIGRNGSGKTTLLRTLAGFQPPLAGQWMLRDTERQEELVNPSPLPTTVGVVLTERLATDGLRVREVVALGRTPYTNFWGTLSTEDREMVATAIRQTGLTDMEERLMGTLSDGERQRVFVAKVLAQHTPVILLDEPTAFLDHLSKRELFMLLARLAHNEGKTILLSTHDLELAEKYADEFIETPTPTPTLPEGREERPHPGPPMGREKRLRVKV